MAMDIAGYSAHSNPEHEDAQRRLVDMAEFARRRARAFATWRQSSGDGLFLVMRPGLDETRALPSLIFGLRQALHESNSEPGRFGRIRLRAALAQGPVARKANGFVGPAAIAVHRMTDCPAVREALVQRPQSDLSLALAPELHRDLLAYDCPGLRAGDFEAISVRMKEFAEPAWRHTPPAGPGADPTAAAVAWPPGNHGETAFMIGYAAVAPLVIAGPDLLRLGAGRLVHDPADGHHGWYSHHDDNRTAHGRESAAMSAFSSLDSVGDVADLVDDTHDLFDDVWADDPSGLGDGGGSGRDWADGDWPDGTDDWPDGPDDWPDGPDDWPGGDAGDHLDTGLDWDHR
jgi:hypothetical protein